MSFSKKILLLHSLVLTLLSVSPAFSAADLDENRRLLNKLYSIKKTMEPKDAFCAPPYSSFPELKGHIDKALKILDAIKSSNGNIYEAQNTLDECYLTQCAS